MLRYPDDPRPVSLDFLRRIDAEPPGTYLGQPKLDGWRRIAFKTDGKWTWHAKPGGSGATKPLPSELQAHFESLPWPDGIGLDMEWCGTRMVEHVHEHSLHVFDLLMLEGHWCGDMGFADRYEMLKLIFCSGMGDTERSAVHLVPCWPNPGLVEKFIEQTHMPISEGLVIRQGGGHLIGDFNRCASNPSAFKCKYRAPQSANDVSFYQSRLQRAYRPSLPGVWSRYSGTRPES